MPVPHKRLTNQLNVCIAVGLAKGDTERFFHLLQEASTRKMGEWGMNSIKPCVSECLAQSNPTRMTQKGSSMVGEPHWVGLLATWFLSYSDRKENQSNFVWWMKLPCLYRVAMLTNSVSFSTDFQLSYFTERHCQHVLCACARACACACVCRNPACTCWKAGQQKESFWSVWNMKRGDDETEKRGKFFFDPRQLYKMSDGNVAKPIINQTNCFIHLH